MKNKFYFLTASFCVLSNIFVFAQPANQNFNSLSVGSVSSPYTPSPSDLTYSVQSPGGTKYMSIADDNTSVFSGLVSIGTSGNSSDLFLVFNANSVPNNQSGDFDFRISSSPANNPFKLVSMKGDATSYGGVTSMTFTGYKNGSAVSGATGTVNFNSSSTYGSITYSKISGNGIGGSLTFDNKWENIDEVRITGSTGSFAVLAIDDLVFQAAVTPPTITTATYDASTGVLGVAGTNFTGLAGATNDVAVSKLTLTGEGGSTYTLTSSDVEITNATSFSVTLNATDKAGVNLVLNKNGTLSTGGTAYNLAAASDWMANATGNADVTGNVVTVSNVAIPAIGSATYDASTGVLAVTGSGFLSRSGATNDIDVSKLTLTGEGGATYTLTTSAVEITSGTAFTVTLNGTDKSAVNMMMNKNGDFSTSGTAYNLAAAEDWNAGADVNVLIADLTNNGVTVSNVAVPTVTAVTYNASTNTLSVTGTGFLSSSGANNDIVPNKFRLMGEDAGNSTGRTLVLSNAVDITSPTSFSITLTGNDVIFTNRLMNKNGTAATDGSIYNLKLFDNWNAGADANIDLSSFTNAVTVTNVPIPTITLATYDVSTGVLEVTGTGLLSKSGSDNDIDITKLTIVGEGGSSRTLTTSGSGVDLNTSSPYGFTITLTGADLAAVNQILNKNGTVSTGGTSFNLAAAEDWNAGADGTVTIADLTDNGITVSNVAIPAIGSATYDASTGVLAVTGSGFLSRGGATNDIDVSKLTLTGEGGATYTLTTSAVEITSGTAFTVTLNGTDKSAVNQILNKNGTASTGGTFFNLAVAEDWNAGADVGVTIADLTNNVVTVSNVATPTITFASYNVSTGVLVVTGTGLLKSSGATNDIDVSKLTLTGEGGLTYTLTTGSVEITSGTSFTVTLNGTDVAAVNQLLNKNGTSSTSGTTYNLAAAEDWNAGADATVTIADITGNGITVFNAPPSIISATYNVSTGTLVVTGVNFTADGCTGDDVHVNLLTLTGEGGVTYTLTGSDVSIANESSFTVTLNATDKNAVNMMLNKNGTLSTNGTSYNLAAAANWMVNSPGNADLTGNGVTVSNVAIPTLSFANYDVSTGVLVVTGTDFLSKSGTTNDIVASKLTLTGEGGATYTFTGSDAEITSGTSFTLTLNATDKAAVNQILNKNGTSSTGGTTYNLAAVEDWNAGADGAVVIADLTGNGVTVSNVAVPTITSATYNASTGVLAVTGTGLLQFSGAANDIVVTKLTLTGEGGATRTLSSSGSGVEISSATGFSITLTGSDLAAVNLLMNKNGTSSTGGTTYNLAAAEDWNAGADVAVTIADLTGNGITVSIAPSSDAGLSALAISNGTLSPTFSTNTTAYTATVSNTISSVTLTPTRSESTATITVNGTTVASGSSSAPITLVVGNNTISVTVTAGDGTTTKTYNITVTREASVNADLSALAINNGTLSPSFASGTTSYTATVSNTISSVTLTPTRSESTATITVNGTTVASGSSSAPITLTVGSNTISVTVTAGNGTTTKTYTLTVTREASVNADLSALAISNGTLSPSFTSGTTAYSATVSNTISSVTLTPTRSESTATITVNGVAVASGSSSGAIALAVGSNTISVTVTAGNGTTTKTYTLTVTREASVNADLSALAISNGTLSPSFASGTTAYTATVSNTISSVTLTPTRSESTATITVNGTTVASGSSSAPITLTVGSNTISVTVTAGDGTTTKTYNVTVTREASVNADLSALAISNGTLSPSFTSGTTAYTATVSNTISSVTLTPTRSESTATITVNGVAVASGSSSGAIALAVGSNTISVTVTAGNGTTTKTYTIAVTREAPVVSNNADLSSLTLSSGTLSPVFSGSVTSYSSTVTTSSITVTPVRAETTATVTVNGTVVARGGSSTPIALNIGANTVSVVVTAGDGTTTKTYQLTITRTGSANADLAGLLTSTGSLSPVFTASAVNYTLPVPDTISGLTLTPTAAEISAVIKVNNMTVTSGTTTPAIAVPDDVNTITISVTAQDGVTNKVYTVTVTKARTTWTGKISNSWTNTANWTNGIPDTLKLTLIPATATAPLLLTTEKLKNLTISTGAVVSITGSLQLIGDLDNNGTISGAGGLVIMGALAQTISGTGVVGNMTIDNSNGVVIAQGNGNTQKVTGILTMNNGKLTTNDNLVLGSDSSGTASVAPISGNSSIAGNVTMQRWLSAQRGYRALGHPFNNALPLSQLTDDFSISGSGDGFETGLGYSTASVSYYDSVETNPVLFKKPLSNAPNKLSTLSWSPNRGILALVRGNGSEGLGGTYVSVNEPTAFAADATGVLNQGTLADYQLGANTSGSSFNLVGNPYPAPVNIRLLKSNGGVPLYSNNNGSTGVGNTIYVYNPFKNAGISTSPKQEVRGGLDAYTNDGNTDIIIPAFGAFFVQAKNTGNVIKFDESVKTVTSSPIAVLGGGVTGKLTLEMADERGSWDDIKFRWDKQAGSNAIDIYDGLKIRNELLDFYSISSDGKQLCIDSRNDSFARPEIIPLGIHTKVTGNSFRIKVSQFDLPANVSVFLKDKLLNSQTELTRVGDEYVFSITDDTVSTGNHRFELAVNFAKQSAVTPDLSDAVNILPNPFKETLQIRLGAAMLSATGFTHVRLIDQSGRVLMVQKSAPGTSLISLSTHTVTPGVYLVEIMNDKNKITKQVIKQ